jgi:hypothetical protein
VSEEPDEETIERRSQNADATFGCFLDSLTWGCLPMVVMVLAPVTFAFWQS